MPINIKYLNILRQNIFLFKTQSYFNIIILVNYDLESNFFILNHQKLCGSRIRILISFNLE